MQAWSLEQSATVATRFRRPTSPTANAAWSVRGRRATCAEEPTDCPSIGWSWARSQPAAVSLTLLHTHHELLHAETIRQGCFFVFFTPKVITNLFQDWISCFFNEKDPKMWGDWQLQRCSFDQRVATLAALWKNIWYIFGWRHIWE